MESSIEERVLAKVSTRTPKAINLRIQHVQEKFLDGKLYTVAFNTDDQGPNADGFINRAYVHGKNIDVYGYDHELLAIVGSTHGSTLLKRVADPIVVSSIIATSVTVAVCGIGIYGAIHPDGVAIPEFLSSGFLLVLGFYFGKSVGNSREE